MNDDIHALAGAYLLDALDDRERYAFRQHLAGCESCRRDLDELRPVLEALAETTAQAPPRHLRDQVLASITEVRPLPPSVDDAAAPATPSGRERAARRRTVRASGVGRTWILGAAAAVLVVIAIVAVVAIGTSSDPAGTPSVQAVLDAPDARTIERSFEGFHTEVTLSRSENRAVLRSSDLPPAPAGRAYQLWYDRPGRGLVPAGMLAVDGDGHAAVLDGPLDDAAAIGVTVEPTGGSEEPTSEPVAVVPLA